MFVFLDNITYRRNGAQTPVLDGLSLFVRSGEIIAIVGPAGAGKTTLLRYVCKRSDGQGGVHVGSDGHGSESAGRPYSASTSFPSPNISFTSP